MSLVFNMVGGGTGGGGLDPSDALIHVNASLGSTVTFAKGGVTVKTISPNEAFANVDGTTADYYYPVKTANYGTWTVTATLGTDSATATVTIDSNKQYDLSIATKWFIRDGVLVDSSFGIFGNVTASQVEGVYALKTTSNNTGGLKSVPIDLTEFTSLVIDVAADSRSWKGTGVPAIGYGTNIRLNDDNVAGFVGQQYLKNSTGAITSGRYTLDVSGVSGAYEIACSVGGSNSFSQSYGYLNIENMYLEV